MISNKSLFQIFSLLVYLKRREATLPEMLSLVIHLVTVFNRNLLDLKKPDLVHLELFFLNDTDLPTIHRYFACLTAREGTTQDSRWKRLSGEARRVFASKHP